MSTLLWLVFWLGGLIGLAYLRVSLVAATCAIGAGLLITTFFSSFSWLSLLVLWAIFGGLAFLLNHPEYRKRYIIQPIFDHMSKALPVLSQTEKIALEAGTVSWDGELFAGQPQWEKLLTIPACKLSEEELAFINGPVKQLCEKVNDWEITHTRYDLPAAIWDTLKREGFFGLIIPKKFGGKGFSAFAHSEILATLASRSLTLASTVAVPNSLGPAELLLRYGTTEQQEYYLPRLATGEEIPCFALTTPDAGSDATSITDSGVVCKGHYNGKEVIGIRLNWNKRYITLAPIATLLGLAFKLYDPQFLLGDAPELGITCALIPVKTPGITIGHRHLPLNIPFQNGPTQGKDVFIPLDCIIGGPTQAGQGWRMLIECLSVGRAISLPSSSVGGARMAALATGAYSRIRSQFRSPLSQFEGIQEVLGRIGGFTYLCEAARHLTISMINAGEHPTVPGAITKYHVTELSRKVAIDAMDVHGGKGIMMGPKNYLGRSYEGAPIAITVEGANILTRSMIIFGQGAIRCHPYLLKEIQALQHQNFPEFEHYLGQHLSFLIANLGGSLFHALTFSKLAATPTTHGAKAYFQQLTRACSAFAFVADVTLALLGSKLKFKEAISSRLGDLLAMMYLASAVLKHHQDQGAPKEDIPLVRWSLDYCFHQFWQTMDELCQNMTPRWVGFCLRIVVMPLGKPTFANRDQLNKEITAILTTPCEARTRLGGNTFLSHQPQDSLALLEKTLEKMVLHDPLLKRIHDALKYDGSVQNSLKTSIDKALETHLITEEEANELYQLEALCQSVIAVDDFPPSALGESQHSSSEVNMKSTSSKDTSSSTTPKQLN